MAPGASLGLRASRLRSGRLAQPGIEASKGPIIEDCTAATAGCLKPLAARSYSCVLEHYYRLSYRHVGSSPDVYLLSLRHERCPEMTARAS